MTELEKGCSLVEEAAKENRRAAKALVSTPLKRSNENASHNFLVYYPLFKL
jgi:hypothetical protein